MPDMKFHLKAQNDVSGVAKQVERDLGTLGDRAKAAISSITSFSGRGLMGAGGPIGLALGAAGGMIGAMTKQLVDQAEAVGRLSQLSGAGAEEFQRYAAGAQLVGIEQDKLADILKDVQDKVGEFLQVGGGPLKDFFEQIAPAVGVTAEQFRGLSGPQALELYVASLQKANISQAEMTFYMEALASDATALIPLLVDNARGMKEAGDEAARLGSIISDETVAAAQQFNKDLAALGREVDALKVNSLSPLIKTLADLAKEFRSARAEGIGFWEALWRSGPGQAGAIDREIALYGKKAEELRGKIADSNRTGGFNLFGPEQARRYEAELAEVEAKITQLNRLKLRMDGFEEPTFDFTPGAPAGGVTKPKKGKKAKVDEWPTRDADRSLAAYVIQDMDAWRREADQLDRIASQWRGVIDPAQKYREQLDEIRKLVDSGRLTPSEAMAAEFEVQNRWQDEINKGLADSKKELGEMEVFAEQAARNIQGSLGDGLYNLLDGNFKSIGQSFGSMLKKMAAEAMAADLSRALLGNFGGKDAAGNTITTVGGWLGDGLDLLGGLFGGARAAGGPVWPGQAFLVGEQGPELFVPDTAGTIVPHGASTSGPTAHVTLNFHATPNKAEAMRLAQQIEASTLAALREAQARNDYAVIG